MLTKINNQSPLLTKDEDAKKGSNWHELARGRATKQHGDPDNIPEGDIHAVRKFEGHAAPVVPAEKTKAALDSLEEQIKTLKSQQKNTSHEQKPPQPANEPVSKDPLDWLDD